MVLGIITIGAIGVTYFTGSKERKEKMRKIGSGIVDVTKEVAVEVAGKTKELVKKMKEKQDSKTTDNN
jgi:hypothetical protein